MADRSKIEWTDASWNPVRGCTKVSAGCRNCYAERFAERFRGVKGHPFEQGFDVRLVPEALELPLRWKKPRRVFVNSMSDLFHEDVPDHYIDRVFAVMALAPRHRFQMLTKRPERMRRYIAGAGKSVRRLEDPAREMGYSLTYAGHALQSWPLPNVWLGVSVEDQRAADERIPHLLATPAAVRFLSCEPLLGPVDLEAAFAVYDRAGEPSGPRCNRDGSNAIGWVIVGGESGPGARPCDVSWVRWIQRQCQEAQVQCFVKQLGAVATMTSEAWRAGQPTRIIRPGAPEGFERLALRDRAGRDPAEWPPDLRVREMPREPRP